MPSLVCFPILIALAQTPDLSFRPDARDSQRFSYDTGRFKGSFLASPAWEGVTSCIDAKSGKEMAKGDGKLGLFHLYRLLGTDRRWGDTIWGMPKTAKLGPDGSLAVAWAPAADHPFEISAEYRWSAADTLDVQVSLRAVGEEPARKVEIFVGSYLNGDVRPNMCLKPGRYAGHNKPEFAPVDVNPLILGTYYMFPRDLEAIRLIYDGRWLRGANPVDWAVSRYMAMPLALQRDAKAGCDVLLMADAQSCFAMAMSYYMDPPDGVANHHSTYISLFGRDLAQGEKVTARLRAVLGGPFEPEASQQRFEVFQRESK